MQTRRQFLRDCSFVAATVALAPAALAKTTASPIAPRFSQFAREVNSRFTVRSGTQTVELVLAAARTMPVLPELPGFEHFSLVFQGPAHLPLSQDTYTFTHARLGSLPIFIVPSGKPNGTLYEAIFNCPTSETELAALCARVPKRSVRC